MGKRTNISTAFNLVKKKHLSLIHSIQDSKLVDDVVNRMAQEKTQLRLNFKQQITEDDLLKIGELCSEFCNEHQIEISCRRLSDDQYEEDVSLSIHVLNFSEFSIPLLLKNKGVNYALLIDRAVDDRVMASLQSNKNIFCVEGGGSKKWACILQFLNSSWCLKQLYSHKEAFIHNEMKVIYKTLRRRNAILNGNIILNKGKEISLLSNKAKQLQIELSKVKMEFNNSVKGVLQEVENNTDKIYNLEQDEFKELADEITDYVGYNESIEGKIISFSYPIEYIDTFRGKCLQTSVQVFENMTVSISDNLRAIQDKILSHISSSEKTVQFPPISIGLEQYEKGARKDVECIRTDERKAGYNGMSAIFSALRTPIYALFPLIMIARFIPSSDVGAIDNSIMTFEGQSVVAVSEIPDTYGKSVTKFVAAVNDALKNGDLVNRDTGKDMFKYSIDEKGRKTVQYSTMKSGNQMPYVILPVYSDREMAAKILMDNILTIQMRLNIVAEVKKIPKILGPFERFFGPLFMSLIMWFIYSKRKSMNEQNVSTQMNETGELKKNKLSEIQSLIKLSETQAKAHVRTYFKEYNERASRAIDSYYAELMQHEEKERVKEMKLYKAREKLFQSEMNNITTTQKDIYEVGKEYFKTITTNI